MNDTAHQPVVGEVRRLPVLFSGRTGEYFGIWIVNVVLTLLTVGIYSAWAKVRRQRYFYGNTSIDGHTFEYHAKPVQILIGRIIVVVLIVVFQVLSTVFPPTSVLAIPLFVFGIPFVIQRGTRFNARVTSYRNVRFDFVGGYWGAMKAYVLGGILAIVSLGLLVPLVSRWTADYLVNNARYGGRSFSAKLRTADFYRAFVLPAGLFVVTTGLVVAIMAFTAAAAATIDERVSGVTVLAIAAFALASLFYTAATRNVVFNATVLDGRHALRSRVSRRRYAWISVSNLVVTVLSLGLMRPWAAIRMARYLASATGVETAGEFGKYVDQLVEERGVAYAEYMDIEGFDVGFGF